MKFSTFLSLGHCINLKKKKSFKSWFSAVVVTIILARIMSTREIIPFTNSSISITAVMRILRISLKEVAQRREELWVETDTFSTIIRRTIIISFMAIILEWTCLISPSKRVVATEMTTANSLWLRIFQWTKRLSKWKEITTNSSLRV